MADSGADILHRIVCQGHAVDHHLKPIVRGGVVAGGDHNTAAGLAQVFGGEIHQGRGDYAEIEHVTAGGGNAFYQAEIGSAHVWTPVTWPTRTPSSASREARTRTPPGAT